MKPYTVLTRRFGYSFLSGLTLTVSIAACGSEGAEPQPSVDDSTKPEDVGSTRQSLVTGEDCTRSPVEDVCNGLSCGAHSDGCGGTYQCGGCDSDPCGLPLCRFGRCAPIACLTAGTK